MNHSQIRVGFVIVHGFILLTIVWGIKEKENHQRLAGRYEQKHRVSKSYHPTSEPPIQIQDAGIIEMHIPIAQCNAFISLSS